jgi:hypothetical protein
VGLQLLLLGPQQVQLRSAAGAPAHRFAAPQKASCRVLHALLGHQMLLLPPPLLLLLPHAKRGHLCAVLGL